MEVDQVELDDLPESNLLPQNPNQKQTKITNKQPLFDLINELKQEPCVASFLQPVDWRCLNITNYTTIIKKPMDLGTLEENLRCDQFDSLEQFLGDLQLIWDNCMKFNASGSQIYEFAVVMSKISNGLVKKRNILQSQTTLLNESRSQMPEGGGGIQSEERELLENEQALRNDGDSEEDDDEEFGLLDGFATYVTFEDKLKLADMMKSASRDKLTEVVKLLRKTSGTEQPVVQDVGLDRFQLKIDQIKKPLFDQIFLILTN